MTQTATKSPSKDGVAHHQRASATHGAVAAGNADAVQAGLDVFEAGGNAFDALIATAFAMGVVEPLDCGLGAGGFAVMHCAHDASTHSLDFMSSAPASARYELYQTDTPGVGYEIIVRDRANELGHRAVAVPGAVAGLTTLHERFGRLPLADCLAPAIALARDGFALAKKPVVRMTRTVDRLRQFDAARSLFLDENGDVPAFGSRRNNPDYASSLQQIAIHGASAFYRGALADAIVTDMQHNDGFISAKDLQHYEPIWRDVQYGQFAGHEIRTMGPPSSGRLVLHGLRALQNTAQSSARRSSQGDRPKQLARAMLAMFQAKAEGLGDPAFIENARLGDVESAETTSLSTMDVDGNAASLTYLLNYHSGVVIPGTGMLLNNQMLLMNPWDNSPNSIAPGKRPASSMMPTLAFDETGVVLAFGASGSTRIPTALIQTLDRLWRDKQPLAEAIDSPRLHAEANRLIADEELGEVAQHLSQTLGLELTLLAGRDSTMGSVQGVMRHADGYEAAGDPRSGAAGGVR